MSDEPPESSGAVQDIGSSQDSSTYLIASLAKFLESMERELTSLEKTVVPPPLFAIQPLNVFALPLLLSVVPHFRDAYTPHQLCVVFLQVAAVSFAPLSASPPVLPYAAVLFLSHAASYAC